MNEYIQGYINRARIAQLEVGMWSQDLVDRAVNAVAKTIADNAEELASVAVEETKMGVYEDKVAKNRNKAWIIAADLSTKKSVGVISYDAGTGISEIAKPIGVVAAITPVTNPIVTPMSNTMFALKGRNAIVITPHHHAVRSSTRAVELINENLRAIGAPENLVQIIDEQSRENTRDLISSADVVIATGGMGMVKAAYSSGKPALGVGAGNVQCIIDVGMNPAEVIPMIVSGRAFDNGIICSAEQSVIYPAEMEDAIFSAMKANRVVIVPPENTNAVREVLFTDDGKLSRLFVGKTARAVADGAKLADAGILICDDMLVLAVIPEGPGARDILSGEKMSPVLALYKYETFEEAVEIARANLEFEGKGHSVSIHSHNKANIEYAGLNLPVSRIVVNQISSTSTGGSEYNGLAPTNTLGCGSWGGNSISENLTYKHLINISRIAERLPESRFEGFVFE